MNKLLFFATLFFFACGKENAHKCCSQNPVFEQFGNAKLFIPNIFTPNADGINDLFKPDGTNIKTMTLTIKKPDGSTVFQTAKPFTEIWDATAAATGKYTFTFLAQANDGEIKNGTGEVCLVRDEAIKNCASCAFSTQFDGASFDSNIPSGESICD